MKLLPLLTLLTVTAAGAQGVTPTPLPASHPLLGTWRVDGPNGCTEEHTLRADGTQSSKSGESRTELVFELSVEPLPNGFYRWANQVRQGNGQPNCGGATPAAGDGAVRYLRLNPGFDRFVLCAAQNMRSCVAEFRRVGGGS